jgi:hypothetical protein
VGTMSLARPNPPVGFTEDAPRIQLRRVAMPGWAGSEDEGRVAP